MADPIPNHFTTEFSKNWIERIQQTKCRLDAYIEFDDFDGERKRYDRIGSMSSQQITDRKGQTRITNASTDNRWAYRSGSGNRTNDKFFAVGRNAVHSFRTDQVCAYFLFEELQKKDSVHKLTFTIRRRWARDMSAEP